MTRAERLMRDGPKGLAWRVQSPVGRWIWLVACFASGVFMFHGASMEWPALLAGHVAPSWYVLADGIMFLLGVGWWWHAWLAIQSRICPLPCNAFHPNWECPTDDR